MGFMLTIIKYSRMTDLIRCEGLGAVNLLDLVDRLSSPTDSFLSESTRKQTKKQKSPRKQSVKSKVSLPCPIDGCDRSFCKETALNNHISRHNRVYRCNECGKCFAEQAKVIS